MNLNIYITKERSYTMLTYNVERVLALRGISRPFNYLVNNGFTVTTADRLLKGRVNGLNLKFVEKLCILLRCTPNDLLSWTPGKDVQLPKELPLTALTRTANISFSQMCSNLPLDELERKMKDLMDETK